MGLVGDENLTCPVPGTFSAQAVGYQENGVTRICLSPVRRSFGVRDTQKSSEQKEAAEKCQNRSHAINIAFCTSMQSDHIRVSREIP